MFTYHQSLRPGGFKIYSDSTRAFWFCVGTGVENHARFGDSIYPHSPDGTANPTPTVDQFIASAVTWRDVFVMQQTKCPGDGIVNLFLQARRPNPFVLRLRVQGWVKRESTVDVNGMPVSAKASGGTVAVDRTWSDGAVTYTIRIRVHVKPLVGAPNLVAFLYGPSVLAADMGTEMLGQVNLYETGHNENKDYYYPGVAEPVLVGSAEQMAAGLEPLVGRAATFRTTGDIIREAAVTLRPFARTHFRRYTGYLPAFTKTAVYAPTWPTWRRPQSRSAGGTPARSMRSAPASSS